MASAYAHVQRLVDRALEVVTGVLLVAMMVDVLFGIADRYILGMGAAWPEEVGRYLLIWVSFLAAAILVRHQDHFAISYFADAWASKRVSQALRLLASSLTFAVGVGFVLAGGPLVEIGALQISPGSEIPMSWVFVTVPVSGVFIAYYSILNIVAVLRSSRAAVHRPGPEATQTTP